MMDSEESDEEILNVRDFAKCYQEAGRILRRARDLYKELYPNRPVPYVTKEIVSLYSVGSDNRGKKQKLVHKDPVISENTPTASRNYRFQQIPIVYTKKLDDMRVFKEETDSLSLKDVLHAIDYESKPKLNKKIVKNESGTDLVSFYIMFQKLYEINQRNEEASSETTDISIDDESPVNINEPADDVRTIMVDSDSDDDCQPLAKISKKYTNAGFLKTSQSTSKSDAKETPGREAEIDVIKLYRRVFLSFICSYSKSIDLYYMESDGSVTEYYNIETDNVTQNLSELAKCVGHVKTVLFKCCCWFKRNEFISLLRSIPKRSVAFVSKPHCCSPSNCKCCCRPKTVANAQPEEASVSWIMKDATSSIGLMNMNEEAEKELLAQEISAKFTENRNAKKVEVVTGENKWLHELQDTAKQKLTLINRALLMPFKITQKKTNKGHLIPTELSDLWSKGHIVLHITNHNKNLEEIYEILAGNLISSTSIMMLKKREKTSVFANTLSNSYSHFDKNLKLLRTMQVHCCWFFRDALIRYNSHHNALNYTRHPHSCPAGECTCCCRLSRDLELINKADKRGLIKDNTGLPLFRSKPSILFSESSISKIRTKTSEITEATDSQPGETIQQYRAKKNKTKTMDIANTASTTSAESSTQTSHILKNALLKSTTSRNKVLEVGISSETNKLAARIVPESSLVQPSCSSYNFNSVEDEVTDLTTPPLSPSPPLVHSPLSAVDDPSLSSKVTLFSSNMACTITTYSVTETEASSALAAAIDPLGYEDTPLDENNQEDEPLVYDFTSENLSTQPMDGDSDPLSLNNTIKSEDAPAEVSDEDTDPLGLESANQNKAGGLKPHEPNSRQTINSKSNVEVEPKNINVDMLISTILDRFRNVRLFINDKGNVTADLNAPLGSLSTAELKVLANILAHAQEQVKSLSLRPGTVLNGQFKMAGKVKAISGLPNAPVNSKISSNSTLVPNNTGIRLPSVYAPTPQHLLPVQPKIHNVFSVHSNEPGPNPSNLEPLHMPHQPQIRVRPPEQLGATDKRPIFTGNNLMDSPNSPNVKFLPPIPNMPVFMECKTPNILPGFQPHAIPSVIDSITANESSNDTEFLLPVIVPSSVKSFNYESVNNNSDSKNIAGPSTQLDKELEETIESFNGEPVKRKKDSDFSIPPSKRREWIWPVFDTNSGAAAGSNNTATRNSSLADAVIEIDDDD